MKKPVPLRKTINLKLIGKKAQLMRNKFDPQGNLVFAKGLKGLITMVCFYTIGDKDIFRVKMKLDDKPLHEITFDGFDLELIY
ncbi:MAG: hypothetical protein HOE19_03895 [Candidatus Komeilibacteria bacterium]|jgi:hypothetical protein|nr:hypothetical protein [Candidatus Komeilibacteria bacterium]MBT4447818.1 hypothetical protein [Candidatus Komeilibacteria bacterium]